MTRVKRGVIAHKRREKLLAAAKGFKWGRKSKERLAREALLHAWSNAFASRKLKKRDARKLWQTKISAGARPAGLSYSALMGALKKKGILLDRKILSSLAEHHPDAFATVAELAKR